MVELEKSLCEKRASSFVAEDADDDELTAVDVLLLLAKTLRSRNGDGVATMSEAKENC